MNSLQLKTPRVNFKVNVNYNLRSKKPANKPTPIKCIVRFNTIKLTLPSIGNIQPRYWNDNKQEAKNDYRIIDGFDINDKIEDHKALIKAIFYRYTDQHKAYPAPDKLKELILAETQVNAPVQIAAAIDDLISFTERFISECESGLRLTDRGTPLTENTIKSYRTFKSNLVDFNAKSGYNMSFDNINTTFFELFKEYLTFTMKYATNTLGKRIRLLKTIMGDAKQRGLTQVEYRGVKYKAMTEATDSIYLNKAELETLYNLDLSKHPKLDRVRDLFLVGCWTGLRFSDYHAIKPENISDGFLHITQQKTGNGVVVPIHDIVFAIMHKYRGTTTNSLPPAITNQKMNEYLKEIGEMAGLSETVKLQTTKAGRTVTQHVPKYTQISTHTARRTFCTNAYNDRIPTLTIMSISGHKTESIFMKYIKVTSMEHATILRDLWRLPQVKTSIERD